MSRPIVTRRQAFERVGAAVGLQAVSAQTPTAPARVPRVDLVNVLEYEQQAKQILSAALFARVSGGDRAAFDRMTLQPRMMVPTTGLDLSLTLFGEMLFAPLIVAPIADQRQFHADGELATVKGASAARAPVIVSSRSSAAFDTLVAGATTPLWYQVFAAEEGARTKAQAAVKAGCKAICVTVGATWPAGATRPVMTTTARDLEAVSVLKRDLAVPVIVKGIATPEAAQLALQAGVQGIILSNHGGLIGAGRDATILMLPRVVEAVKGRVPVLVDGSIRRGTDVLKALALGATAVVVGRPVMWGLAAYGADGVQGVLEMLQTELARYMCMSGKVNLRGVDAAMVKVHRA